MRAAADVAQFVRGLVGTKPGQTQVALVHPRPLVVESPTMPKRREKLVAGGDARIVEEYAPSPERGLQLARRLLDECPEGYHPWRVEIQKSDRGRRASVRVWFKRNQRREG